MSLSVLPRCSRFVVVCVLFLFSFPCSVFSCLPLCFPFNSRLQNEQPPLSDFRKDRFAEGWRSAARRSLSSTSIGKDREGGSGKVRKKKREKGRKTAPDESDKYCVSFSV